LKTNVTFSTPVQEGIQEVELLIRAQADGYHPDLNAALDLILSAGGKRVRPNITLLTGRMLGAPKERLVTLAAAIELLHTATLVHDDLIDGSLLRRGMPTLNSQWSPGATVLTGDFLFARAAKLAADTDSIPVMKLFAKTLTVIVNGEITQLFSSRCKVNLDDYYRRIYAKTASLFETSAWAPALVIPVDHYIAESMRVFGYEIGMAFQIVDDILDYTGEQATLGKPIGNDLRQGLITLPSIRYVLTHPDDEEARDLLGGNCIYDETRINHLVDSIRSSDAIQFCHQEAERFVTRGIASLRQLPYSEERQCLEDLATFFIQRKL
jgi:geranylgeranyl pyrophosphate synthase